MQARKFFFKGQLHGISKMKVEEKTAHFTGNFAVFTKGIFCWKTMSKKPISLDFAGLKAVVFAMI